MTVRLALYVLAVGAVIGILGAVFMFQHWPFTGILLVISTILVNSALLTLLFKFLRHPGSKAFLDL